MRLKVLGAYGASDAEHNLTGYLIDDWLAVDAGTLTSKLSLAQQSRIQAVYITHTHADHIRDLPHLIPNRFVQNVGPLTIYAAKEVMTLLTQNLFNGIIWPRFAAGILSDGWIDPDLPQAQISASSRPICSSASSARSRCSRVCVAMHEVRIIARPRGTAGDTTGLANTPSSWSRIVAR